MDNLITRLLQIYNLVNDENSTKVIETPTKVAPHARGGHSNQEWCGSQSGRTHSMHIMPKKVVISCTIFNKTKSMCLNEETKFSNEEYQEYLMRLRTKLEK